MATTQGKKVVLLPGDGIGPEIADACVQIFRASGAAIEWIPARAGEEALKKGEPVIPGDTLELIDRHRIAFNGPITTPVGKGHTSANVALRKRFHLFANVRPAKNLEGIRSRYSGIDLVVIRENTEDLYSGIEHEVVPGVVESIKVITADASERVARFAFEYARKHGRKKVTVVHKANIMKMSDGLFIKSAAKVHADYKDIGYDEIIVDNLCHQLVIRPEQFDVLLCQNLYGDIVSDLCAGLVGGLGVAPAANYGNDCAIFEAIHGSAPDIAGRGIANPTAMLLSGCLMLDYLGFTKERGKIESALGSLFKRQDPALTPDQGGTGTTQAFTDAIVKEMSRG